MATTRVTFRLDEELIDKGRAYARARGTTLNDMLRTFLADYAAGRVDATGKPKEGPSRSDPKGKRRGR